MYAASSGGIASARKLDIVSNNIANVNTVGYKAERLITSEQSFSDTLASKIANNDPSVLIDQKQTPGVIDIATYTDFSQGPIKDTGNPFDVALTSANQFFVVNTPEGEAFTRAGNFTRTVEGALVTQDGYPVLGEGGQISLPPGKVDIASNGAVTVDGGVVGQLRVVSIEDTNQLKRSEGARFVADGDVNATSVPPNLVTGALEMPNVQVVEAMVEMINAQRSFEAYTKSVQTIDELNNRALRGNGQA